PVPRVLLSFPTRRSSDLVRVLSRTCRFAALLGLDDGPQPPDCFRNLLWRSASKSQDEPLAKSLLKIATRKRPEPKVAACRLFGHGPVGHPFRKRRNELHAGFRPQNFDTCPELPSQRLNEYVPTFAVDWACSSDVTRKMTLADEIVKHCLIEMRRINIHRFPGRKESVHEVSRNHDVTETQGREQGLAERSDIDNA